MINMYYIEEFVLVHDFDGKDKILSNASLNNS
jgi:hypothetical protein